MADEGMSSRGDGDGGGDGGGDDGVVRVPAGELECPVCMKLLYDPVSLPACTHTFCRLCLHRALEVKRQCPLCRQPTELDALAAPPHALLARLLESCAGEAYRERAAESAVERRARRPRLGVFVLPGDGVYVPGARVDLFIYEPRYRVMVARAMATTRRFLAVGDRGGAPSAYGCVVRIDRVAASPDGRSQLQAVAVARARVSAPAAEEGGHGLVSMEAEEVVDEPPPAGDGAAEALEHLAAQLRERLAAMPGGARLRRVHGEPPEANPAELSLWVCRAVGGRPALVEDCLLSPSVAERLRLAINLVDESSGLAGGARGLATLAREHAGVLTMLALALLWWLGVISPPSSRGGGGGGGGGYGGYGGRVPFTPPPR